MHGGTALTPEIVLDAYAHGVFPMAERRDDPDLFWVSPDFRGILPLDGFHVSKRLARTVRSDRFTVTTDRAFEAVMRGCAAPAEGREQTWMNAEIFRLYAGLHAMGHAHSIECWRGDALVGGLYGVNLGGAFFGESMFSRERDASKVALVHLVAHLIMQDFELLDAQFLTRHLKSFGAIEIPRSAYLKRLAAALQKEAYWSAPSGSSTFSSFASASGDLGLTTAVDATARFSLGTLVLQVITQTS
ncbi:MAG TPA: leucyl/phenylalanyl-tRNA--protein transferase [Rhizomicrobium sp.]|jgi:leucyl/phenylalanyl-tRNA--protein transferase